MVGGKSLKRKPTHAASGYRDGYLKSGSWFVRRRRWFEAETRARTQVQCAVCDTALTLSTMALHHYDYSGVIQRSDGTWVASEKHEDLEAFCRSDHEALHRLLDRDRAWSMLGRKAATHTLIRKMRARLAQMVQEIQENEKSMR